MPRAAYRVDVLPCFGSVSVEVSDPFCSGASSVRAVPTAANPAATAACFATRFSFAPAGMSLFFDLADLLDFVYLADPLAFVVFLTFDLAPARFDEDPALVRLVAFFMIPPSSLEPSA